MSFSASSRLILFMGIQLVVGRFACGFLCSYKRLNNWYIHQALLLINGVSTMLLTLATNYEAFVAYAVIFGFCDGAWATLNNIVSLTCVDPARAASACGFMLLAGSATSMIGPPISGRIGNSFPISSGKGYDRGTRALQFFFFFLHAPPPKSKLRAKWQLREELIPYLYLLSYSMKRLRVFRLPPQGGS